jgi:hypothetical protein
MYIQKYVHYTFNRFVIIFWEGIVFKISGRGAEGAMRAGGTGDPVI